MPILKVKRILLIPQDANSNWIWTEFSQYEKCSFPKINEEYVVNNFQNYNNACVELPHPHTLHPSVQFVQISIWSRPFRICVRNCWYSLPCQIFRKEWCFRSPSRWVASLSKQQGTTIPSQVITQACQSFQQWLARVCRVRQLPSCWGR